MNERSHNFLIGLTSIIALLGIVLLLMLFGELDNFFNPSYQLTINTYHASGLREGSAVELNGVPIGNIDTIVTKRNSHYGVQIIAQIDTQQRIPSNVRPFADSSLLGGSATLVLEAAPISPNSSGKYMPTDGTATINGELRIRLIEQITAELDSRIAPLLESLAQFSELGKNINALLAAPDPDLPADQQPLNLRSAMVTLNAVLTDVHEALDLAKSWLGDDQLRVNAVKAVKNANTLIEKATLTIDQYSSLATSLETDANALTKKLLPMADSLALTLEEVRRVALLAREGQGSVALLLNNPDLYMSLTDAAARLDKALIELHLLIQKIRDEGVPLKIGG